MSNTKRMRKTKRMNKTRRGGATQTPVKQHLDRVIH